MIVIVSIALFFGALAFAFISVELESNGERKKATICLVLCLLFVLALAFNLAIDAKEKRGLQEQKCQSMCQTINKEWTITENNSKCICFDGESFDIE